MHAADFAAARLREIKERVAEIDEHIISGMCSDHMSYRQSVERRLTLREVATLIREALDRYEARS